MKILIVLLLAVGCTEPRSPETLKKRDAATEKCIADCAPRKMDRLTLVLDCLCVDEQDK